MHKRGPSSTIWSCFVLYNSTFWGGRRVSESYYRFSHIRGHSKMTSSFGHLLTRPFALNPPQYPKEYFSSWFCQPSKSWASSTDGNVLNWQAKEKKVANFEIFSIADFILPFLRLIPPKNYHFWNSITVGLILPTEITFWQKFLEVAIQKKKEITSEILPTADLILPTKGHFYQLTGIF